MQWMILVIAGFCLALSSHALAAPHGGVVCGSCHRPQAAARSAIVPGPASPTDGCVVCHTGYARIFDQAMAQGSGEKQFVQRSYGRVDAGFWDKNCSACHLRSCLDCHEQGQPVKPGVATCQKCHKGYYTGWDYSGRAPREDNQRYQRGMVVNGETFLKMLPDVHYRAGMTCGACHSMQSLIRGQRSSKSCRDCHRPSMKPVEHRIPAHLERLECYACHSAWGAQEYGTFFLRFRDQRMKEDFDLKPGPSLEYLRSAYLKRQDAPPLGINSRGRISPIRPLFIAYYTDIMSARNSGPENTLLAAEWRAWFPHTVQRGCVTCEGCHDNPTRFLLEPDAKRIYNLKKDGLGLESFWLQDNQRMVNGSFLSAARYLRMSNKSPAYTKAYIEKWKTFLNRVENSSRP